jgi:hypothetical protein
VYANHHDYWKFVKIIVYQQINQENVLLICLTMHVKGNCQTFFCICLAAGHRQWWASLVLKVAEQYFQQSQSKIIG